MDVVSDILQKIKLSSAIYFKSNFSAPWGMKIPKGPYAQFHMVTKGSCILNSGREQWNLEEGDIVIFPFGLAHGIADNDTSEQTNGMEVVQSILNGNSLFAGTAFSTTLVCGHFEFDRDFEHSFIQELPEIIHLKGADQDQLPWLKGIVQLIIEETKITNEGSHIITNKLGEVLFVHSLRAYLLQNKNEKGFIAALQDERIGKALSAIHNNPDKAWELKALAQLCGMSRTSFSMQFKALMGATPLSYLRNWRVLQAKELLRESQKSVGEIAENVGYRSEAAFNRVFKKQVSQTPLKYRQATQQG